MSATAFKIHKSKDYLWWFNTPYVKNFFAIWEEKHYNKIMLWAETLRRKKTYEKLFQTWRDEERRSLKPTCSKLVAIFCWTHCDQLSEKLRRKREKEIFRLCSYTMVAYNLSSVLQITMERCKKIVFWLLRTLLVCLWGNRQQPCIFVGLSGYPQRPSGCSRGPHTGRPGGEILQLLPPWTPHAETESEPPPTEHTFAHVKRNKVFTCTFN